MKMLDSVLHAGIRLATGAFRSSPIARLLVDAGELPLELHRQSSIHRYWYRLQRLPNSLAYQVTSNERYFRYYVLHPKYSQSYGYRARQLLNTIGVSRNKVLPYNIPVTLPWKFTEI